MCGFPEGARGIDRAGSWVIFCVNHRVTEHLALAAWEHFLNGRPPYDLHFQTSTFIFFLRKFISLGPGDEEEPGGEMAMYKYLITPL